MIQSQQQINLSQIKMQKLNHLSVNDILRKRKARMITNKTKTDINNINSSFSFQDKDFNLVQEILDKIKKLPYKSPTKYQLTFEEKSSLIDFISSKENISFNKNALAGLLSVWKYPNTHELQLLEEMMMSGGLRQSTVAVKAKKSFYILKGKIALYEKMQPLSTIQSRKKGKNKDSEEKKLKEKNAFRPQPSFDQLIMNEPIKTYEQFSGLGPVFKAKQQLKMVVPVAINAIIVEIKQPQFQNMIINNGGMEPEKKMEILQHFSVFNCLGRKIQNVLSSIEFKKYTKNEPIYKAGQQPQAVYLIIKGEIIFDMRMEFPTRKKSLPMKVSQTPKNISNEPLSLQTETLGGGNYFGEEQIILRSERMLTAICQSAECNLLQIPILKFEKLLLYSDFYDIIKKAVDTKVEQRQEKIDKAMEVFLKLQQSQEEQQILSQKNQNKESSKKKNAQVKIMHGNVIRRIPAFKTEDEGNFSMLNTNPDMYQATLKKFRKLTMKPPTKVKPEVNWKLKRVWKVLNLENVLREDAEVGSPEGKKFFESHRRLQNHVNQVKSLRPKTSSSTYRTKLQYIAYLQQFNT